MVVTELVLFHTNNVTVTDKMANITDKGPALRVLKSLMRMS